LIFGALLTFVGMVLDLGNAVAFEALSVLPLMGLLILDFGVLVVSNFWVFFIGDFPGITGVKSELDSDSVLSFTSTA
jgi:hypothetical protein